MRKSVDLESRLIAAVLVATATASVAFACDDNEPTKETVESVNPSGVACPDANVQTVEIDCDDSGAAKSNGPDDETGRGSSSTGGLGQGQSR